ncbi:hypothetical protein MASR2M78_01860 [Treponema sp.]
MRTYPSRQIHLDFHTSPLISGIGSDFSKKEFGQTLKDAGVQSINIFAKCHHGLFYYPTKLGPIHPEMKEALLPAQIEACRENGILFSVYTCVGWNEACADAHPEWQEVTPDGILGNKKPFQREYYQWKKLCLNNLEYRALMKAELKEEFELFKPYGFWIDIVLQHECVCESCKREAAKRGLDLSDKKARQNIARLAQIDYMRDLYAYIKSLDKSLHVYFNGYPYAMDLSDDPLLANSNKRNYVTYMDIESLPSTEWGYTHYPIAAHYVNKYNFDLTMMNGKFHLAWGDFGSLRNQAALEYECFRALSTGAGICIGDQLHPSGKLDAAVYERIGKVLHEVEKVEPWCLNTKKIAQIGVYGTVRSSDMNNNKVDKSAEGAYRILTDLKYQYDFIDTTDSLDSYELVILPDAVCLPEKAAEALDAFVERGGRVIATAFSGLDESKTKFLPNCFPVDYCGNADTSPRYMDIETSRFPKLPAMSYVAYLQGAKVSAIQGAENLAYSRESYFNRTDEHFCSHRQTPPKKGPVNEPAICKKGGVVYISNPLFADYAEHGVKAYKEIIGTIIETLLDTPMVKTDLPAYAEVTIRKNLGLKNEKNSLVVHILAFLIQRKCQALDIIEESVPLFGRTVSIRCKEKVVSVKTVPEGKELPFKQEGAYVILNIDVPDGRAIFEINKVAL